MTDCVFPRAPPEQLLKFLNALTNDILDYILFDDSRMRVYGCQDIQTYTYLLTEPTVLALTWKLARKFLPNKFPAYVAAILRPAVLTREEFTEGEASQICNRD